MTTIIRGETDTLILHRRMYERRMKRLRQLGGLAEQESAEEANDPSLLIHNEEDTDPPRPAARQRR